MNKILDFESKHLEGQISECLGFINYYLSEFNISIMNDFCDDKKIISTFNRLQIIINDYFNENDKLSICDEIIVIDEIINNSFSNFRSISTSKTYALEKGKIDKIDREYSLEIIDRTVNKVLAVINKRKLLSDGVTRDKFRQTILKEKLSNLYKAMKMEGCLSISFNENNVEEIIDNISKNYYEINFCKIKKLFINCINSENVDYSLYELEMERISTYVLMEKFVNEFSPYVTEELKQLFEKIKELIVNYKNKKDIHTVNNMFDYLLGIKFIRFDYPSCNIWQEMFIELFHEVIVLISEIEFRENVIDIYNSLKFKYMKMVLLGKDFASRNNSLDTAIISNIDYTERQFREGLGIKRLKRI